MTQEQDDRILASRQYLFSAGNDYALGEFHRNKARMCLSALDHLTTRLSEVERERDEAVQRLNDMRLWAGKVQMEAQDLHERSKAQLATLRAAIAEAVDALKAYDDATPEHGDDCRVGPYYHCTCDLRVAHEKARELRGRLRNLTKPDTPSERIMSDKDRENPVEGAHPLTKPEGEDALVEALREVLPTHNREVGKLWAANLRKALASRGLVRGEGVERG